MNLTFRCDKCKYPHHFESEELEGKGSVTFSCTGCGTHQEVELPFKKKSREDATPAAARIAKKKSTEDH